MSNSCKGCNKRTLGCHSNCEDYKNYKKDLDNVKQKIKNDKMLKRASYNKYGDYDGK